MKTPPLKNSIQGGFDIKRVVGGILVQHRDLSGEQDFKSFRVDIIKENRKFSFSEDLHNISALIKLPCDVFI